MTADPIPRVGRGSLSRRGLLTGAAGLVAGVGGTQAVHLLGAADDDAAPRPPSPGEELMTEHGVLKRILLVYRAAADQLTAGVTPPVGAVVDAARLVYDYVESFHEGLEEAYVFPRVRAAHPDLVRTLLIQHDRGRHLTARIYRADALDLTRADARDRLRTMLGQFVRMYEPHEAWEDTVIYPALRLGTPQRELDLLAERFADLENSHYGDAALQQMLDRVAGIEEQLGVADLAAFTPDDDGP
ncbi:hemerythrin domain-containing protein [Blastococcus capsensis]|uniref:hemerythrin domain-containing protein n=1 Tax=Blastococcus capsensis TaxID=1564163 RepID=UPI0025413B2D|nr:hemerythrin domain-containing protein [Blastococcus capsensis]MDK3256335.1 hemerythrin domain-containing protein [Blastococcus capsensis]